MIAYRYRDSSRQHIPPFWSILPYKCQTSGSQQGARFALFKSTLCLRRDLSSSGPYHKEWYGIHHAHVSSPSAPPPLYFLSFGLLRPISSQIQTISLSNDVHDQNARYLDIYECRLSPSTQAPCVHSLRNDRNKYLPLRHPESE